MEQVYIFDFGDKIKAGYSTDVQKRRRVIELSSGAKAKQVYSVQAGRAVEKLLHSRLENRLLGEFFAYPFDKAKIILDEIVKSYTPPTTPITDLEGDILTVAVSEQIKILCVKLGISVSELGRLSGKSPQAFSQKMKRETFTTDELKEIAAVAGCRYEGAFILPNGEKVTY